MNEGVSNPGGGAWASVLGDRHVTYLLLLYIDSNTLTFLFLPFFRSIVFIL